MKISRRGLYALRALIHLAESYDRGLVKIHEIADVESIPEKFLEGILVQLKNARVVTSHRGREGGYRLRRPPDEIPIGDVIRGIDGPLAPFGDAAELAHRIRTEARHPGLFRIHRRKRALRLTSEQDSAARSAGRQASCRDRTQRRAIHDRLTQQPDSFRNPRVL